MCLQLTEDSTRLRKNLRRRKKLIVCYKVLTDNLRSPFYSNYRWSLGSNTSSRTSTNVTNSEKGHQSIDNGFHLYLNNPQITHPCRYPYPCPHPCPYPYLRPCPRPRPNPRLHPSLRLYPCPMIIYKCTVEPKDVVAVGKWNSKDCIVATKATLVEEIGRLWQKSDD